jgi:glycosyltransferase involved in cell wall biosynthesis
MSVPYNDEQTQLIDSQSVKKSYAFQQMVAMGGFRVIEASDDRIEQNLLRLSLLSKPNEEHSVERKASGSKIEVILRGHFYETTGYSKVNRSLALNLYRKGCLVEIDPISFKNNDMNEMEAKVFSMFRKPVGRNAIQIDSVIPTQGNPLKGHYNILYTTSEALSVPKQFIDASNEYDEIWVTSSFSQRAFENSGSNRKITVVPPILNSNMYKENVLPYSFRPKLKSFVFLSVLTWGYRKGSDALIKAFARSFSASDDVSLLLLVSEKSKTAQDEIRAEIRKELGNSFSPHVCLCTKPIPEYQLPSFYKACNAFVLPSRGEGFGLPFCEASLCGLIGL